MSDFVVIGRINATESKRILIEYESIAGTREVYLPKEAIVQRQSLGDGRTAFVLQQLGAYNPLRMFTGTMAPSVMEAADIEIVSALESGEPIGDLDDEAPTWESGIDAESMLVLVEGDDGEMVETDVWNGSLLAAGRISNACDWRFQPLVLPAFVPMEGITESGRMMPRMARVNDKAGHACQYHIFNPNFQSEKEPAGAHLGAVSDRYFALSYEELVQPLLDHSSANDWQATVTAFDRGKHLRMDCDVSGVAGTREEATARLKGHSAMTLLDDTYVASVASRLHGMWKYGFTVFNSLNGKGALRVQAAALRLLCANGATVGKTRNLLTMRHNKGIMEPYDWDTLGNSIGDVIVEAQAGLVALETTKNIPLLDDMFERLTTLCARKGLLTLPKEDKGGNLRGNLMWELFGHGWTNPHESWVAVPEEEQGTLFHAYQVMSGAITHQPQWTDGKRTLKGAQSGISAFNTRLRKLDDVFSTIGSTTMQAAMSDAGKPVTGEQVLDFVNDNQELGILANVPPITEVLAVVE